MRGVGELLGLWFGGCSVCGDRHPPTYFLVESFQQELNIHNVVDTKYRKLALKGVILGFGVVLPILALLPGPRDLLRRLVSHHPDTIEAARSEAEALKQDFLTRQLPTKCGLHKR
ncbi:MAG: hypothetical protein EP299_09425, partial [Acidobacteria bacterium]